MSDECKECKYYIEKENRCIFTGGYTEKCSLYEKKEYHNSRYVNRFDIECSECGEIVKMAIRSYHNYCCKCGNKLQIKERINNAKVLYYNKSKILDSVNKYRFNKKNQKEFIRRICQEYDIDGDKYILSGNGFVNSPFTECYKTDIRIRIEATENNLEKFNKELTAKKEIYPNCKLVGFRKNSKTMKDIQQKCIDEHIVINLCKPRVGDYIKELAYGGYRHQEFEYNDKYYVLVESDKLKDEPIDGFEEIKGSEYYTALEELKLKENKQ